MKRAIKNLVPALMGATLSLPLPALAAPEATAPDVAQLCAQEAFRESGETRYAVVDVDLVFYGHSVYRVKLDTPDNLRVECRVRDTRVTKLTVSEIPATAIARR